MRVKKYLLDSVFFIFLFLYHFFYYLFLFCLFIQLLCVFYSSGGIFARLFALAVFWKRIHPYFSRYRRENRDGNYIKPPSPPLLFYIHTDTHVRTFYLTSFSILYICVYFFFVSLSLFYLSFSLSSETLRPLLPA